MAHNDATRLNSSPLKTIKPETVATYRQLKILISDLERLYDTFEDLSDTVTSGSSPISLTKDHILVGNAANMATDVAMSGDATIISSGALTLATVLGTPGAYGAANKTIGIAANAKGLITALSDTLISITKSQVSDFAHDILSASHSDALVSAVARGGIIVGNATPKWAQLALGAAGKILRSDGTDLVYSTTTWPNSATIGDVIYASAANTYSNLPDVATGNALISGGVGVAPSWGKIGLTTHITGTLPVGNGGTGLTTFGGTNTVLYTTAADVLASSTNFTYDGTTITATGSGANIALLNRTDDDNNTRQILSLRRSRSSATAPGANFGGTLAFSLEGSTNNSFATAGAISTAWKVAQTNDTTDRDSYVLFSSMNNNAATDAIRIDNTGNVFIGANTVATAVLHLAAGATAASSAPLKFTSGTNMTTAENGAMEYNGTNLFFTRTGAVRESVGCGNSGATAPATNAIGVVVDYYGTSATRVLTTPDSWWGVNLGGTAWRVPLYTP